VPNTSTTVVVAAVIRDENGRILLSRRPDGTLMGGLWEFPGGKVDEGESPKAALARELEEELGVRAEIGEPVTFAVHEEPELRILLLFFTATLDGTRPAAREGQQLAWVAAVDLPDYPTPPADAALVATLSGGGRT
jgi:8-oxo-dGTP diphosphatase